MNRHFYGISVAIPSILFLTSNVLDGWALTIDSQWLSATDGNWTTASNWSTDPIYPHNGAPSGASEYDVLIDKVGAPYTVTLADKVSVSSLKLDSPDATLVLVDGISTNSLDVSGATVTVGTTSCCTHSLDVFDDVNLTNGSIRLVMSQNLYEPAWIRFLDNNSPQAITGQGKIVFAQGRVSRIFPGKELTIGPSIVIESNAEGEFRNGRIVNDGTIRSNSGSTLDLKVAEMLNRGKIEVAGVTTIGVDATAKWLNEGSIRIKPGGKLILSGQFTTDDLGTLIDEGASYVWLTGVLENTGKNLDLQALNLSVPLHA